MRLESERLILRDFESNDWKDLYAYLSQEETVLYEPYDVMDEQDCKKIVTDRAGNRDFIAVCLKNTGKVIGNLYFSQTEPLDFDTWELGYVFNAEYSGYGYATEACKCLLKYAFTNLNVHRVMARCNVKNTKSWRLLERLHFTREGYFRQVAYFDDLEDGTHNWHDAYEYAMLKDDFE